MAGHRTIDPECIHEGSFYNERMTEDRSPPVLRRSVLRKLPLEDLLKVEKEREIWHNLDMESLSKKIPRPIAIALNKLKRAGFEAYIVGGCVRDLILAIDPKDWDITTNAKPEEIQKVFPDNFYENKFLTVTAKTNSRKESLKEIEITTYRIEAKYTDRRHPDEIGFAKNLEQDLARRELTINAMAFNKEQGLVDLFGGEKDIEQKIIRAVGDAEERFSEDALRMIRAVRFAVTLGKGWKIEPKTAEAIKKNAELLKYVSKERVRDEFLKIIMARQASEGIELLRQLFLLRYIVPELEEGYGIAQNKHHIYECYEHNLKSLEYAAKKGYNKYVRIAALFHDIAKPRTKQGMGDDATFYGHEMLGAKMTRNILERLKFSRKDIEKMVRLVRYHLFYYDAGEVTESSVRKLVRNIGKENLEELLQVRYCDRIGSGCPKAEPYKLRHLKYVVERLSQDPISAKMLKVSGDDVMEILKITPGPKVGQVLNVLLEEVLDEPKKNRELFLKKEIKRLGTLPEEELLGLAKKAKEEREKIETKRDKMTKEKYWVS